MQEKEFDKLMSWDESMWTNLNGVPKMAQIPNGTKRVTESLVKRLERPIQATMLTEMQIFIARHRALGMSEKNIRKAVQRKWGIKIVKPAKDYRKE